MKEVLLESAVTHFRDSVAHYVQKRLAVQGSANLYAQIMREVEAPLIEAVMQTAQGNQSQAARLLGISRTTLLHKLKQLGFR